MTDIAALGLKVEGIQELERLLAAMEKLEAQQGQTEKSQQGLNEQQKQSKKPLEDSKKATEQLTEAERKFAEQASKAGMSVGELKNALRGLPAQFTDIAVSLQGGQAPLTVFLQQGGQLKDMFGGAGIAARAMAGYVTGLINPFSLAATAVIALGAAYYAGSREQDAFRISLATTGNAIGETTGSLAAYSKQIAESTGTQGKASESLNVFIQAGVRAESDLARFTETAIRWEKATGEGVDAVAEKFSALQKDPVSSALKLNESMNFLTLSTYEQIKALEDQDDAAGASALAMSELDRAMADRSKNIEANLGYIEKAWSGITGAAKKAWDAMLNVGRPASLEDQLGDVEKELERLQASQGFGETGGGAATGRVSAAQQKAIQDNINALQAQKHALLDKMDAERMSAAVSKMNADQVSAQSAAYKEFGKYLKDDLSLSETLAQAKEKLTKAKVKEADIEKILAGITEEYNKKNKTRVASTKALENSYRTLSERANEYVQSLKIEEAQGEKLTKSQQLQLDLETLIARGKGKGTDALVAKTKAAIAEAKALEDSAEATKLYNEAVKETDKVLADYSKKQQDVLKTLQEQVTKLQQEEEAQALAKEAKISLAQATERLAIARLREYEAQMLMGAGSQAEIERIREEIRLREQLLSVTQTKDAREAYEKGEKEQKKYIDDITKYLSDGMYDAIVGDGANALEALKRMAKNTVIQPMIKAGVQSLMGAAGLGGEGGLTGSASSLMSSVSNVQSLYSAFSGGLVSSMATGIGTLGATFGSSALSSFAAGMVGGSGIAAPVGMGIGSMGAAGAGGAIGAGATLAAAIPWVAGAVAIASLLGAFKSNPKEHTGGVYSTTGTRNEALNTIGLYDHARGDFTKRGTEAADQSLEKTIGGVVSSLDVLAKSTNTAAKQIDVFAAFATNPISKDQDAYGYYTMVDRATGQGIGAASYRQGDGLGNDPAVAYSKFTGEIATVLVKQIVNDLPGWMGDAFNTAMQEGGGNLTIEAFSGVLQQIAQIDMAFAAMGQSMAVFADLTDETQTALMRAFGGIDGVAQAATGYYQAFYTEEERMVELAKNLQAAFGIDPLLGDKAAAQFRETTETALKGGQDELLAQLLAAAPAFKQVADYAQDTRFALSKAWQAISEEQDALRVELLRAKGDTEAYTAALREQATQGYNALEIAAWDYTQTLKAELEALEDAAEIRRQQYDLDTQILQLLGDTAALRQRELAALDPALRAQQQRIYALQDEAEETARLAAITQQYNALNTRYLSLTGNTVALRNTELEAIDESNRWLQERIWALEDAAAAEQAAAQRYQASVQAVSDAWQVVQDVAARDIERLQETFSVTDSVFRALKRAIDAQRAAMTEQVAASEEAANALKATISLVKTSVQDLRGEVEGTAQLQFQLAADVIRKAAGGALPDTDKLADAIRSVSSVTQDAGQYGSSFERDFAVLALANELEKIQLTAEPQLTVQEQALEVSKQQLAKLDETLASISKQIDVMRGVDDTLYEQTLELLGIRANTEQKKQITLLEDLLKTGSSQVEALVSGAGAAAQADALRGMFGEISLKVGNLSEITGAVERAAAIDSIGALIVKTEDQISLMREQGGNLTQLSKLQTLVDEARNQHGALYLIYRNTEQVSQIQSLQRIAEQAQRQADALAGGTVATAQAEALRAMFGDITLKIGGLSEITSAVEKTAAVGAINDLISKSENQIEVLRGLGLDLQSLDNLDGILTESKNQLGKLSDIDLNTYVTESLLNEILKAQTAEELAREQITGINELVSTTKRQHHLLSGISSTGISLLQAIGNLSNAMGAVQHNVPPTAAPAPAPAPAAPAPAPAPAPAKPSTAFDARAYLNNQVSYLQSTGRTGFNSAEDVLAEIRKWGMSSAEEHYKNFGWQEGVNPNSTFNTNAYLSAKVQQLNRDNELGRSNWTIAQLNQMLKEQNMSPLEHYARHGQFENIPGFAKGGYYQGGLALVGEQGPELINFQNPGQVYTSNQTQNILSTMNGNESVPSSVLQELKSIRMENQSHAQAQTGILMQMMRILRQWDATGIPQTRNFIPVTA